MEYYYTDIDGSAYEYDVNLAANYGIFDIESSEFDPSGYVTREFAAHTANSLMNYLDDGTAVSLLDSDAIYYEYDAKVAVQRGWFTLSSGKFLPESLMTEAEEQTILEDAQNSAQNTAIDPSAENLVQYQDSVVSIDEAVDASYFDGTVTLSSGDVSLSKGDVFRVTIDGISRVYKAKSVSKTDDGKTIVAVSEVDLKDAVSDIDIQGYGDVDYDNIMFYGTSSSSSDINLVSSQQDASEVNPVKSQVVRAVEVGNGSVSINETIDLGGVSVDLSGTISDIKPEYKLDYNGIVVNDFYLNAHADADFSCTMSKELVDKTGSKEIKLVKVPVLCGGVMSANLVISISVSVTGKITMSYSWNVSGGISYVRGEGWRVTKNFQKKGFSIEATGSEKIAVKGALDVELLNCPAGEIYIMGGEKGTFTLTPHTDEGVTCKNLRVYAFAEFGASVNLFDIVKFPPKSYEFINENNSPLRFNRHWENDKLVDECRFDADATNTNAGRRTGKAGYYSDYSPYGLEFDGLIAAPDDSSAYQTWDESVTLDHSVTVSGDLYLENNVDLDGYTLTVTGSLYQTGGGLHVNGGTLNIGGSYEISSNGFLDMDYNSDSMVNVSKDFTIKNTVYSDHNDYYEDFFSSGTLSIGGNFYQYIAETTADNFVSESNHVVKFVGEGTHEVYFDSVDSCFANVELDDGAKLKFTGIFTGFPLKQDIVIEGDTRLDAGRLALNGHKLTIEGSFTQDSAFDVYSGILDVQGDYVAHSDFYNNGEKPATVTVDKQLSVQSGAFFDVENTVVNVSSDLIQTGGQVHINGGTLNIGENYEISSNGFLDMDYNSDSMVNVSKDFTIKNTVYSDHNDYYEDFFSSGTLSIGGNFYQYIAGTDENTFVSTENHVVKFVGAGKHTFYSESTETSLANLTLDEGATVVFQGALAGMETDTATSMSSKPEVLSAGKNTITALSAGISLLTLENNDIQTVITVTVVDNPDIEGADGDVNGDGEVTIADAVLLQKWLLAVPDTRLAAWNSADMNRDGSLSAADLTLLKCKLLYS